MTKDNERIIGKISQDKVLAFKIGQTCSHPDCQRQSKYYLNAEYFCKSHFKSKRESYKEKGLEIIFPSYQEPKFPRIVSNFLVYVPSRRTSLGKKWGKRLHQTRGRRTLSKSPQQYSKFTGKILESSLKKVKPL